MSTALQPTNSDDIDLPIIFESQPQVHENCVFLGVDEAYFPYALFVAHHISENHPNRDFDICIATDYIPDNYQAAEDANVRIVTIDMSNLADSLVVTDRFPVATYLRVAFAHLFKTNYSRALYLDADVYHVKGDLSRLLNIDLLGQRIGACQDDRQLRNPDKIFYDFKMGGKVPSKLFNSGVMLFDLKAFHDFDLLGAVIDWSLKYPKGIGTPDQTTLNLIFYEAWAELSIAWNFPYNFKNAFMLAVADAHILHIVGPPAKPWETDPDPMLPAHIVQTYRRFFQKYMPELVDRFSSSMNVAKNKKTIIMAALLNLYNVPRLAPRLEDDADPWRVRLMHERKWHPDANDHKS